MGWWPDMACLRLEQEACSGNCWYMGRGTWSLDCLSKFLLVHSNERWTLPPVNGYSFWYSRILVQSFWALFIALRRCFGIYGALRVTWLSFKVRLLQMRQNQTLENWSRPSTPLHHFVYHLPRTIYHKPGGLANGPLLFIDSSLINEMVTTMDVSDG